MTLFKKGRKMNKINLPYFLREEWKGLRSFLDSECNCFIKKFVRIVKKLILTKYKSIIKTENSFGRNLFRIRSVWG